MNEMPAPDIPGPLPDPTRPRHALPPGSCDSHAHIFGPAGRYPYSPAREYTPPDASLERYAGLLRHLGFQRAVLVQPSVYGNDNRLLVDALRAQAAGQAGSAHAAGLDRHAGASGITWRGIVVIDEHIGDDELQTLDRLGVRGVRLNLVFKGANLDFDGVERLARRIEPLGWHLQFLIDITRFEGFAARLSRLPVPCVLDHMGHFPARLGPAEPSFRDLLALMREGRTWAKVSGPNRLSGCDSAPFTDVEPLVRALVEAAPDRLVFGTDWPHTRLKTSMPDDGVLVDEFFRWIDDDAAIAQKILVDNPRRLYRF